MEVEANEEDDRLGRVDGVLHFMGEEGEVRPKKERKEEGERCGLQPKAKEDEGIRARAFVLGRNFTSYKVAKIYS